jgi:hypothetical protein
MYKAGETSNAFLAGFHNLLEIVPGDTYLSKHFVITYHQAEENWAISMPRVIPASRLHPVSTISQE